MLPTPPWKGKIICSISFGTKIIFLNGAFYFKVSSFLVCKMESPTSQAQEYWGEVKWARPAAEGKSLIRFSRASIRIVKYAQGN